MILYQNNKPIAAIVSLVLISTAILVGTLPSNTIQTYAQAKGAAKSPASVPKQTQPSSTSTTARPSSPSSTPVFRYPSLVVVTHVNSTKGVNAKPDNFTQVVTNTYRTSDGYAIAFHLLRGSDLGVNINLRPGTFAVTDQGNSTSPMNRSYNTTYSGDCTSVRPPAAAGKTLGLGVIRLDDSKSCVVTKTFVK